MTSDLARRSLVAMFDLERDELARRYLPESMRHRVIDAVRSLKATYPFPSLVMGFGPRRRLMPFAECQKVFIEAFDHVDREVRPILDSRDEASVQKRMELLVLRGQFSVLAQMIASLH